MIIKIPQNNILERTYIIDILIGEFLGLSYSIEVNEITNYHLIFEEKEVIVEDHFFNNYPENLSYLKKEAIPDDVSFVENQFTSETDVPMLFGNDKMIVNNNQILCGNDIFAASFFMLTRWEEYVNTSRDIHNRFSAKDSVAYKFGFLDRPIVNEYVELLWNMFSYLGYQENRKEHSFEFILTHDVDDLRFWKDNKKNAKVLLGDIIKRKNIKLFAKNFKDIMEIRFGKKKDPFDTFDELMSISEQKNLQSRFYFMSGGTTKYDNRYDIKDDLTIKLIRNIEKRGHLIGFHPSYDSYNNEKQWSNEKKALKEVVDKPILEGRQHYLRFDIPFTWRIWEENNMTMDCSVGYADREGFRCGVCFGYSVFDFLNRKKYKLKEFPLLVMEASLITYQNLTPEMMEKRIKKILDITLKYKGSFVFLWHNSSFNTATWKQYSAVYKKIIKYQNKV
ncbi:polysaccharide deacetylase family protein [Sporosarcina jiandibaonis]|uniref:polysaccharide deacetylase family protein n=1 Tax=Sporosarcina jiandibaonis TaxID=2715535 RepID=UPI001553AB77|nr:polysaccharide deacetylase family protein [Sporosarcina jiandibaonis]